VPRLAQEVSGEIDRVLAGMVRGVELESVNWLREGMEMTQGKAGIRDVADAGALAWAWFAHALHDALAGEEVVAEGEGRRWEVGVEGWVPNYTVRVRVEAPVYSVSGVAGLSEVILIDRVAEEWM